MGMTFSNLCDSCTNIGCEFQSGIVRTKCAFYMPPQLEPDNCGNYVVQDSTTKNDIRDNRVKNELNRVKDELEPTTKNDLAVEKTDMIDKSNFSQEQYKTDLQSAYDSGYEQAKNDLEVDWESYKDVDGNSLDDLILEVLQNNFDCGNTYGYKVVDEIIGLLPSVAPQKPKTGYISIDDVMSVFDDFMCGEVDEEGTETFLEMLKDKAESEVEDGNDD